MKFIKLTDSQNNRVLVNPERISYVTIADCYDMPTLPGSHVYFDSVREDEYLWVKETRDEIAKKLEEI